MKLSRKGEYAIKALLELASADASGTTSADIARKAQIPEPFLNQIMLTLKNAGLLRSRRGARGGYVLNRGPEAIIIGDVARLMDGPLAPIPCASVTALRSLSELSGASSLQIERLDARGAGRDL